jgi:uncharacterized membrane protein YkvA (DUF1232 family)
MPEKKRAGTGTNATRTSTGKGGAKTTPANSARGSKSAGQSSASKSRSASKSPSAKKGSTSPSRGGRQRKLTATQVQEQAAKYKRKASPYRKDPKKTEKLLKDAEAKARNDSGPLSGRLQDLATLLRLVRAYYRKEYRDVPWETIALAIGAIAYFVTPTDLIPDFIPVAGYLDDAAVIGFVIASIANDLHAFREWEAEQQLA